MTWELLSLYPSYAKRLSMYDPRFNEPLPKLLQKELQKLEHFQQKVNFSFITVTENKNNAFSHLSLRFGVYHHITDKT